MLYHSEYGGDGGVRKEEEHGTIFFQQTEPDGEDPASFHIW